MEQEGGKIPTAAAVTGANTGDKVSSIKFIGQEDKIARCSWE